MLINSTALLHQLLIEGLVTLMGNIWAKYFCFMAAQLHDAKPLLAESACCSLLNTHVLLQQTEKPLSSAKGTIFMSSDNKTVIIDHRR